MQDCQERKALRDEQRPDNNRGVPKAAKTAPPPKVLTDLPERLVYARKRAGFTQKELATRSKINASQLSRLEAGERVEGIEASTAIRLAQALGVPVGWLIADEGDAGPVPVFEEPPRGDGRRRRKSDSDEG